MGSETLALHFCTNTCSLDWLTRLQSVDEDFEFGIKNTRITTAASCHVTGNQAVWRNYSTTWFSFSWWPLFEPAQMTSFYAKCMDECLFIQESLHPANERVLNISWANLKDNQAVAMWPGIKGVHVSMVTTWFWISWHRLKSSCKSIVTILCRHRLTW